MCSIALPHLVLPRIDVHLRTWRRRRDDGAIHINKQEAFASSIGSLALARTELVQGERHLVLRIQLEHARITGDVLALALHKVSDVDEVRWTAEWRRSRSHHGRERNRALRGYRRGIHK